MRSVALVAVVVLAGLLVSGCDKRAGLLAEQRGTTTKPASAPSEPPPTWRLAEVADTGPGSELRDVAAVDATHAWAVGHDSDDPTKPGITGVPMVLRWDGLAWSRMDLPGLTWRGGLTLVAAGSATDVWAVGGQAGQDPTQTVTHLLRYDGTAWAEVPFPPGNGATVTDLAVARGHVWLVGYRGSAVLVHEWDGSAWRQHTPPRECTQGGVSFGGIPTFCNFTGIVAFAPDDVWVAGNAAWPGFKGPLLFHWDGTEWVPVKVGIDNAGTAFSEIAGSPSDLWAVGHRSGYGGPVAVRGDGRTWTVVDGLPVARLTDIAVDDAGNPWVLENFPASATLATFRGGRWADTPAPQPPDTAGVGLHGITPVPGTAGMLAVGNADLPGEPPRLRSVLLEYRR